jgi:hypothetical protein
MQSERGCLFTCLPAFRHNYSTVWTQCVSESLDILLYGSVHCLSFRKFSFLMRSCPEQKNTSDEECFSGLSFRDKFLAFHTFQTFPVFFLFQNSLFYLFSSWRLGSAFLLTLANNRLIKLRSEFSPIGCDIRARICKPFKEIRNRFPAWQAGTTTLFDVPAAKLHWLVESIPWNRILGSLNVYKYGLSILLKLSVLVFF